MVKYLTIDDVCEMLSISRRTLERLRGSKSEISESRAGRAIRQLNSSRVPIIHTRCVNDNILFQEEDISPLLFPKPDLMIGNSPRWEQEKLINWLRQNGHRLQTGEK